MSVMSQNYRWQLRLTDFGLQKSHCEKELADEENKKSNSKLFWQAPELLREKSCKGSQKGDVYSFAIVCYEMFRRPGVEEGPFVDSNLSSEQILENIRDPSKSCFTDTRPNLKELKNHADIEPPSSLICKQKLLLTIPAQDLPSPKEKTAQYQKNTNSLKNINKI